MSEPPPHHQNSAVDSESLLASLCDHPEDDLARLIHADWLEEHGLPERAELIRVQVALAGMAYNDPRRPDLEDREHSLLSQFERDWLGHWPKSVREWRWQRGFVDQVATDPRTLEQGGLEAWPIDQVSVIAEPWQDLTHSEIPAASASWLKRVRRWDFSGWGLPITTVFDWLSMHAGARFTELDLANRPELQQILSGLERARWLPQLKSLTLGAAGHALAYSRDFEPLDPFRLARILNASAVTSLSLFDCGLTVAGLQRLLCAPLGERLTELDISGNHLAPDGWQAFHRAPAGMPLRRLDLSGTALASIALEPLLHSDCLQSLVDLDLSRCGSARTNFDVLARSRFWTQAQRLRAHSGTIPARCLEPLCKATGPPQLEFLDLADNFLRTEGVAALCEADWSRSLRWLSLSQNYLDDDSVRILAESGRFTQLHSLHLARNNLELPDTEGEVITDLGVRQLALTPSLARLRILTLNETDIGDETVDALLHGPHWKLSCLGIAACRLTPAVARILAESPRLARLEWLDLSGNPRLGGSALRPLLESPYLSSICELDLRGIPLSIRIIEGFEERLGPRFSY